MCPTARNSIIRGVIPNGTILNGIMLNGNVNINKNMYRYKTEIKR